MSKVTIGHDSCSAWTCGDEQGPSFVSEVPFDNNVKVSHTGMPLWPIATLVCPVIGIYVATKAASKAIRSSR